MNFDPYHLSLVVAVVVVAVCAACLGQAGSPVEPGKPLPISQCILTTAIKVIHCPKTSFDPLAGQNITWCLEE